MAPPKDIARSYPKRGLTADVGFRSEPKFCGDGSAFFDADYATGTLSTTPGSSFSYGLWMNVSDFVPSNESVLMLIGASGGAGGQVAITLTSTGRIKIFNGATFIGQTAAGVVSLNTWHFIAVTVDGSAGGLKIYSDGIEVTGSHTATFNVTDKTINVGALGSPGTYYADGNLANAFYCTEILTQDQVRQIMRFSSSAQFSTITGMESFYPLSADFNDAIGSANLTNNGATLQSKKPQLPRGLDLARGAAMARVHTGRAIELDGAADYLQTTLDSALGETFTVSAWMYRTSPVSGFDVIWETGTFGANASLRIAVKNTDEGLLDLNDNATTTTSTIGVGLDRWAHVVICAIAGSGNSKIYVDGVDATPASHSTFVNATNALFEIGRYIGGAHYFKGYISDVRVFNSALTADQVKELFHYPEQVLPTGVSASNLIHRWALSDYNDTGGTGGRYFQDSAGSNAMEDKSSAGMEFAQPVPCPQLGLQQSATRLFMDGSNSNKATVTLPSAPGSSFSFQLWVNMKSVNTSYALEYGNPSVAGAGLAIRIVTGTIGTYDTSPRLSGLTISNGEWAHIVMATSDSSPYWRCWVNGSEASSPAALTGVQTGASTAFTIGQSPTFNYGTDGTISNCAFWTTRLDTSDVAALYNSGDQNVDVSTVQSSSLVGWWKCDDFAKFKNYANPGAADATVAGAAIGQSFPENASGSTLVGDFSMKRKGVSVLNFGAVASGANEYALSSKDSAFLPSFANGGAFSCFFRVQKLGEYSSIFINDDYNSGIQHRFAVYVTNANKLQIEVGDGASARAQPNTTTTISDSEWHHFAFTVDYGGGSTTTFKLFLDGVLDSTSTATTLAGVPNATQLRFGDYVTSGTNEANGPIACLKFYQVTLSENEIKQIYNSDLRLIKGLANE